MINMLQKLNHLINFDNYLANYIGVIKFKKSEKPFFFFGKWKNYD